jgi:DNA polymerase
LWLRAERAFGLSSVSKQALPAPATPEDHLTNLFGNPEKTTALPALGLAHGPDLDSNAKRVELKALDDHQVRGCTRCRLCEQRTNTVFGEGDPDARIVFVGEGPGETEDQMGRPFVGRSGEKLNEMIRAMGLTRDQVYIANIVKCRPPQNREPAPDEVATCTPFLERQIEIIRPKVIVTLGRPALQFILGKKISISRMRGQWLSWRGTRLMPTFHPAYILRNYTRETREAVWSDLQQVMKELGMKIPARGKSGG